MHKLRVQIHELRDQIQGTSLNSRDTSSNPRVPESLNQ